MTVLALGGTAQGLTQLSLLGGEASMTTDVANAAKTAVTQGEEDAAVTKAVTNGTEAAAKVVSVPATNGWVQFMNSQVTNQVLVPRVHSHSACCRANLFSARAMGSMRTRFGYGGYVRISDDRTGEFSSSAGGKNPWI